MNAATEIHPRRKSAASLVIEAILGAIMGAVAVSLYLTYAEQLRWADVVALMIAFICVIGALRLFAESFDPRALAERLGLEGDVTEKERRDVRLQAFISAAFGVTVIWPPLATLNGGVAPVWSYVLIAAFLAVQVWSNWRMGKSQDEYSRAYVRHLTWGGFIIGQTALLGYACAERLGLAPPLTAWDVFMVFTALSIVVPLFSMRAKVA
jgi:hypothetical protein